MTNIRRFINSCFIAFLGLILLYNLILVISVKGEPGIWNNEALRIGAFAILSLIAVGIVALTAKKNFESEMLYYVLVILSIMLGLGLRIFAVLKLPCQPISDYRTMYEAAELAAVGDFSGFAAESYLYRFPHMSTYTIAVAGLFKLFGANAFVIKIFNLIFQTLAIFFISLVGRELFGRRGGVFAAFLYAVFPADIFYAPVMATENFAIPFFILSLYFLLRAYKSDKGGKTVLYSALCGIILCIGSLLRGVAPFYIAAYVVAMIVLFHKWNKLYSVVSMLVAFVIVFQIVSISFYSAGITSSKLNESPEPITIIMLVGFNYDTRGMYSEEDRNIFYDGNGDKKAIDEIAKKKLYDRVFETPGRILPLFRDKTGILWQNGSFDSLYWSVENSGYDTGPNKNLIIYYVFTIIYFMIIVCFSLIGAIANRHRNMICILALLPLAFQCGLMLIEVQPRYTFSVAFIFILTAVSGFATIRDVFEKEKYSVDVEIEESDLFKHD